MNSRIELIIERLSTLYPMASPELEFTNPFEMLIATMLSAQCTDKRVNEVTRVLFKKCPDAQAMSRLAVPELEEIIKSCGLYHMKAVHILETCKALCEKYNGNVPRSREELTNLPGVGSKTAGVVMMAAFGEDYIPVDTHVFRLAHRLKLVENAQTPDKVEKQLSDIIPKGEKGHMHHLMIWHGRRVCKAIKPTCAECPLYKDLCNGVEDVC